MPDWAGRWLEQTFFGLPVELWLWGGAVVLAVLVVVAVAKRLVLQRVAPLAERTASELDDLLVVLVRRSWVVLVAVVVLALVAGAVLADAVPVLRTAAQLAFLLQLALWGGAAIDFWVDSAHRKRLAGGGAAALAGVLRFLGKVVLWSVLLLVALDNLGVDVTTLVAGLGVGGVALALATQNILGDLFASLSIALDKPFVIGDTIGVGDFVGTVESVGVKTTRLRSVSGEQLVFANGDLLQSRLRNFARMTERRVVLGFGVSPATDPEALARIPVLVRELVEAQIAQGVAARFDRAHLKNLGSASFDFETVYWVLSPDYTLHMDLQQAILLGLVRRLREEGIDLATGLLGAAPAGAAWLIAGSAATSAPPDRPDETPRRGPA